MKTGQERCASGVFSAEVADKSKVAMGDVAGVRFSHKHMKPHHEIEIKLEVGDPRGFKERLRGLGFQRIRARHFERNLIFDFPNQRLRAAGCLLRLRLADGESVLTFKEAARKSRRYKIRSETEVTVADGQKFLIILRNLGLQETFCYEKYRTVYAQKKSKQKSFYESVLVYDETPIGVYLELEGTAHWIDKVAQQLGYRWEDYILSSYTTLYHQKCRERGAQPKNMIFSRHKS